MDESYLVEWILSEMDDGMGLVAADGTIDHVKEDGMLDHEKDVIMLEA